MRAFLKNILLLSVVLLVVTTIVELLLLTRPNTYSYKRSYVEAHLHEINYLLLGNSHIEEGLNPEYLPKGAFNMAKSGRRVVYDVELAKRYIPKMDSLRAIVMPLNYGFFYFGRESDNPKEKKKKSTSLNLTDKCMYYKYMGIRVDGIVGFLYWSEFLCSKEDFMSRFVKSEEEIINCTELGYVPLKVEKRTGQWKYMSLPKLVDTTKEIDPRKYDLLARQYGTIAKLAQERNVRFVLLGTPFAQTYQEMMNPAVQSDIDTFVRNLQREYNNVEYYNYNRDSRFCDDDFCDAGHLSESGANKFSKIVKEEIFCTQKREEQKHEIKEL